MALTCRWWSRWLHRWRRHDDLRAMTFGMIKGFPDPVERSEAWAKYREWPENRYWRCACAREDAEATFDLRTSRIVASQVEQNS